MMVGVLCLAVGAGCAGLAGFLAVRSIAERRAEARRRSSLHRQGDEAAQLLSTSGSGLERTILEYAASLDRRLSHRATMRLVPRRLRLSSQRAERMEGLLRYAGVLSQISAEAVQEARVRLGLIGAAGGVILGACLSNEFAALLGIAGAVAGARAPVAMLKRESLARTAACRREMPEFLEVVALGLKSGLTFDRSFQLYWTHFDTGFARDCSLAQQKWTLGIATREEALREMASSYDSDALSRVVDAIVRAMRFGTSLAADLEKAAADSQADQRAMRQEEVAKAPVRMMIPTATLILPAMLLMVLGPVLLELMEGF